MARPMFCAKVPSDHTKTVTTGAPSDRSACASQQAALFVERLPQVRHAGPAAGASLWISLRMRADSMHG